MCGIIGYLGLDNFNDFIISGLKLIQNRGYDSVGIGTIINNELVIKKYASTNACNSLDKVQEEINTNNIKSNIAIGHTRWATHGGKTNINAHPHTDNKDRIAIVHNGIIENFLELKINLEKNGYHFKSSTDTEIIVVQIGYWLDQGFNLAISITKTIEMLSGTWALAIIDKLNPYKLWVVRNGSPLLLGFNEKFVLIVSEQISFGSYINNYIVLNNHDLIEITFDKELNKIIYSENIHSYHIKIKTSQEIHLSPKPYQFWMEKEIMEQSISVSRALNNGGRIESNVTVKLGGLESHKDILQDLNHLILLGCGTSFNAGLWSLNMFKSLEIFDTITIYDGAEFNIYDIPRNGKTGLVLLSQSGETKDLHRCLQIAKENNLITIGIINVVDSMISRETTCGVYLNAGREVGVASTKSFTSQCVVLTLVAIWFSQLKNSCIEKRKELINNLKELPSQIDNILNNWYLVKNLVNLNIFNKSCFILGKSSDEAIAKEGALKLKEISYIHTEGFSSSALKHGPFALITPGLPIIILDTCLEHHDKNMNALQEVKAREANVILIGFTEQCDLKIEYSKTFSGILANIYLQILSFEIAIKNGYNPDFPRNLAKVVTVE